MRQIQQAMFILKRLVKGGGERGGEKRGETRGNFAIAGPKKRALTCRDPEVTCGVIDEVAVVKDGVDVQRIRLPLTQSQSLKGCCCRNPAHMCEYRHDGSCLQSPLWKPKHANRKQKTLPHGWIPHPHVEILLQIAVLWKVALAVFLDVLANSSAVATSINLLCPARVALPFALGHVGNEGLEFVYLLLIAVMSPFGVGPEAAADAAVEEDEDVDETVADFALTLKGAMKWVLRCSWSCLANSSASTLFSLMALAPLLRTCHSYWIKNSHGGIPVVCWPIVTEWRATFSDRNHFKCFSHVAGMRSRSTLLDGLLSLTNSHPFASMGTASEARSQTWASGQKSCEVCASMIHPESVLLLLRLLSSCSRETSSESCSVCNSPSSCCSRISSTMPRPGNSSFSNCPSAPFGRRARETSKTNVPSQGSHREPWPLQRRCPAWDSLPRNLPTPCCSQQLQLQPH